MALTADQQKWLTDTGRESYNWADIPTPYENIPGIMDIANNATPGYDPQTDIQAYFDSLRQGSAPGTADQGDYELMTGQTPSGEPVGGWVGADGTGTQATANQLDSILAALKGMNAQPGVDLSGIGVGDIPTFEVPGQNLSPAIDQTLLDSMTGSGWGGLDQQIRDMLAKTQGGGFNSDRYNQQAEAARERLTAGETAAQSDLQAVLADRGLISLPGSPEGAQLDATTRAFEPLQKAYLSELRQSGLDESLRADDQELNALTLATGWSKDQAAQKLAAADAAGGRQQMLSEVALKSLDQNMEWNKFLAQFGLDREKVAADIQQGRVENILPILQMFISIINASRGGHV